MNRAERRRVEKETRQKVKRPATFNVTRPMLDTMVKAEIKKDIDEMRQDAMGEAINTAMILLLTLPLEVLMDHYLDEEQYREVIPEFTNYVLEYYEDWQNDKLDMDKLQEDLWEYGGVRLQESEE